MLTTLGQFRLWIPDWDFLDWTVSTTLKLDLGLRLIPIIALNVNNMFSQGRDGR